MAAPRKGSSETRLFGSLKKHKCDPLTLLLDSNNPRFPPDNRRLSQSAILELMLNKFAIDEIAQSICAAGFLPIDPFIGHRTPKGSIEILEGNRRLATIKLLLDPKLVPDPFEQEWSKYRSLLTEQSRDLMQSIEVLVCESREDANVLAYIGFRHVNGVLSWEPEERAAFVARLVEDPKIRWSYDQIAHKLGSRPSHIERLYVTHRLIEQTLDNEVPGADRMRKQFGVLTRALQSTGVASFLGVEYPRNPQRSKNPATVPREQLAEFVRWTFGTDDEKPVLTDSRDLTKWGKILQSEDSLRYLRSVPSPKLERAFAKSAGLKEGLIQGLYSAGEHLEEAVSQVPQFSQDPEVQSAFEGCAYYFFQIIVNFPQLCEKHGVRPNAGSSKNR
ncbi:MAG: ParB N-terminal domain-containing protein [Pirellulales bacterium]